ncbi:MAG TPA: GNAT family N-acetyltransferase [Anaerolineales bacterium]|nr:GNAT family N-acetyltransferase [Anaerolineales bacterium]
MIEIRHIQPEEWLSAKRVVYRVAYVIFGGTRPLEDFIAYHESIHELKDMDDIQKSYFDNGGTFLVMFRDGEMICTGAIRTWKDDICELKRLWLLAEYHGQGLGYYMLQELLSFSRQQGYKRIRLETDPVAQSRALEFYRRIGFYEIPGYTDRGDEVAMEMEL